MFRVVDQFELSIAGWQNDELSVVQISCGIVCHTRLLHCEHMFGTAALDRDSVESAEAFALEAHREFAASYAKLLQGISPLLSLGVWKLRGFRSPATWLAASFGVCADTALAWVREAELLEARPGIASGLVDGALSVDCAKAVMTLSRDDAALADLWIEASGEQGLSAQTLRFEARKFVSQSLVDEGLGCYLTLKPSYCESYMDLKGRLRIEDGCELMDALDALVPDSTPLSRFENAWSSSLVQLVRGSGRVSERRPTVVIHVQESELERGEGVAVTESGQPLPIAAARALSCDANIEFVAERAGQPLIAWSARRLVGATLRRAVIGRDRCCQFPGCGSTRNLDVHHIKHWINGGKTEVSNLILLCVRCHKGVHRRGLDEALARPPNS